MSELVWVTVPGGKDSDVVLRVLIAPRLDGNSLVDEGMEHWPPPDLMKNDAMVKIDFAEAVDEDVHCVYVKPIIQAKPDIWESFFGPNITLSPPGRRSRSLKEVEVESTSSKADKINYTFTKVAKTPFGLDPENRSDLDRIVYKELKERWSGQEETILPAPPLEEEEEPCLKPPDFHQIIAMLREHPAVLKALGLIIELRVPLSDLPIGFTEGIVRVSWPDAPTSIPKIISPWTKYDNRFLPGSTTNIDAGLVTLTDNRWDVVTVDVDNGEKKLQDAANSLAESSENTRELPDTKSFMMPALRTAGLMLIRRGRQGDFANRRQAADTNARNPLYKTVFTADDLVLGYRIDIREEGMNKWSSLHVRDAKYKVNEKKITNGQEEGHIKSHAAIIDGHGTLRADEIVACWRGFSLAVPRPSADSPNNHSYLNMPFRFQWEFSIPEGILPCLRFAHAYQIRARVADIAGGGIKKDDQTLNRYFTDSITYRRYEPVSPPELALPSDLDIKTLSPGETINRLVIRSDFAGDVSEFNANAHRLLYAPKTPLTLSEQHKAFDGMTLEQIRERLKQALLHQNNNVTIHLDEVLLPDYAAGGVCVFPRPEPGGPSGIRMEKYSWDNLHWPDFGPMEIVLKERTDKDSNIFEWKASSDSKMGGKLIVRLFKAEELTLELSSFLKADFLDHFAIFPFLPNDNDKDLGAAVRQGRHPMVTPAETVTLTHAVRSPLKQPMKNPELTFTIDRSEGMNYAILSNSHPLQEIIDINSTGTLEITASWDEYNDYKIEKVNFSPVKILNINREDKSLPNTHHEFGDTRHRKIKYTLTAVSRFRQYFKDENDEAFVKKTDILVNIPSSARPSPPVVLSTRPAFCWEDKCEDGQQFMLKRQRQGGHLRVELDGSWNETGEGEQLAVLVSMDNKPTEKIMPFITQVNRDPINSTPLTPDIPWLTTADFSLMSGEPCKVYLKEADIHVMAVPHKPWFHEEQERWFVDIAIPRLAKEAYCPFIQLALVRYQPETIKELEPVSSVVMTEMVQLFPDRTLFVRRNGNMLFVKMKGIGPNHDYHNNWKVYLEKLQAPPGIKPHEVDLTALELSTEGIPAWVPVEQGIYLQENLDREIKFQIPTGNEPFRIRIQEIEGNGIGGALDRTVYSDTVIIPDINTNYICGDEDT
ncbi:hypothetical protein PDN39_27220 [Bacillus cereus]|nr:hypothetical protein [Bacillus cereus]